jgi:Arc/MetJ-type ribon-helix-helix transcriptional regulator
MSRPLPTRIAARCTQEFKDQVVEAANYNGDDYSEVIRKALEAYVKRTKKREAWDRELAGGIRV